MTNPIDLGGNDLIVNSVYIGATGPGQAGTLLNSTDLTGITPGTATASKALVLNSSKGISTVTTLGVTTVNTVTLNATGAVLSSSPSAGVGYATGAGGAATQATNKSTAVAFNSLSGAITMNNAALAAATIVSFTFTNTSIAATDVLVLNHISGGTVGSYTLNAQAAAGSATINVRNNTAGSLSDAIVIQFAVIKGVNA